MRTCQGTCWPNQCGNDTEVGAADVQSLGGGVRGWQPPETPEDQRVGAVDGDRVQAG